MRVLMIGGTKFIGRRITEELLARGDEVTVVHRGETEPEGLPGCAHLHADRRDFASLATQVKELRPDAVVDTLAMTRADTEAVLPYLPDARLVVLSSGDVYRAFELQDSPTSEVPLPIGEESPVRRERYPYRGKIAGLDDYDKLDVEPLYLERGGTVLRLGFIYGEHDPQRREEFILRRVRAGRRRIPAGTGCWLLSRCYVGDVASAVLATLGNDAAGGEVFNIVETASGTVADWMRQILAAAGHDAELVTVPDPDVPGDMDLTRHYAQHLLFGSHKAQAMLGWRPGPPEAGIAASVRWHLANPPDDADQDFTADDRALATAAPAS
ncbi:MAG TPA: NAD-dependent epimerase/dehydratase family protein [Streptosporangiaceae bacterium]|jgi:UDP-glucose 4-epimerase